MWRNPKEMIRLTYKKWKINKTFSRAWIETTQMTPKIMKPFSSRLQNELEGCRNNSWTNLRKTSRKHQENTKKTFKTLIQSAIFCKDFQENDVVMILWLKSWWDCGLGLSWVVHKGGENKGWIFFLFLSKWKSLMYFGLSVSGKHMLKGWYKCLI